MRQLLNKHSFAPDVLVTDKLRSYAAPKSELRLAARLEQRLRRNNGRKIRICRRGAANAGCNASNRLGQLSASRPFTPPSITPSTSNATSYSAARSASSDRRRCGRGERPASPKFEGRSGNRLRQLKFPSQPQPAAATAPAGSLGPRQAGCVAECSTRNRPLVGQIFDHVIRHGAVPVNLGGELFLGKVG